MLSAYEAERAWLAKARAAGLAAEAEAETAVGMTPRQPGSGPGQDLPGPCPGLSPREIIRDLQERQAAGVIVAAVPGPEAWGGYESLPGGLQCVPRQVAKGDPLTPGHSAAEGAVEADQAAHGDAERRRRRGQAEAEPARMPEVDHVDVPKAFRQAVDVPEGYPAFRQMHAEEFRRGALPSGYEAGQPVPVPSATLNAGMIVRPVLTDGHARPCPPER